MKNGYKVTQNPTIRINSINTLQGWRMRFSKISVKNMNDYVK